MKDEGLGRNILHPSSLLLAKPQTFMNASGESLQYMAHWLKIAPPEIFVVVDDADFEPKPRFSGTHNPKNRGDRRVGY